MNSDGMVDKDIVVENSYKRLMKLHATSEWLLDHWKDIPDDLYKKVDDEFLPYDIKMNLVELLRQDFANALTPMAIMRGIDTGDVQ